MAARTAISVRVIYGRLCSYEHGPNAADESIVPTIARSLQRDCLGSLEMAWP